MDCDLNILRWFIMLMILGFKNFKELYFVNYDSLFFFPKHKPSNVSTRNVIGYYTIVITSLY